MVLRLPLGVYAVLEVELTPTESLGTGCLQKHKSIFGLYRKVEPPVCILVTIFPYDYNFGVMQPHLP